MTAARAYWLRISTAAYRFAIRRVGGSELPSEDEAEIVQVFSDELDEAAARGPAHTLRVLALTLVDMVVVSVTGGFEPKVHRFSRGPGTRRRRRRGDAFMARFLDEIRYALRTLVRSPSYALTACLILTLAVGANATIFTLVEHLFLAPPEHVSEPDRLVRINRTTEMSSFGSLAYPDYQYYRDYNDVFDGLMAYDPGGITLSLGYGDRRRTDRGWFVSGNYFDVLGVRPAEGRFFRPDEDVVDAPVTVVVISHRLWRDLFERHSPIGETLQLNGQPFTVIGVAPEGFAGVSPIEGVPDLWIPITTQPLLSPLAGDMALKRIPDSTWVWLWSIGRLRADVAASEAQANMSALAANLEMEYPEWNEGWKVTVSSGAGLHPPQRSSLGSITRVLLMVALAVLLVACSNIAILLLARNSGRRRETGVRKALGANGWRIASLMLGESLVLGVVGAVGGFALAFGCTRLAYGLLPAVLNVPPTPGLPVLGFSVLLALGAALVFTLVPARQSALLPAGRLLGKARLFELRRLSHQSVLVGLQVFLSTLLVIGGALLVRSLISARSLDLGFETEGRIVMGVDLRNHGYESEATKLYVARAMDEIRVLPGVEHVAIASLIPFRGAWTSGFTLEGAPGLATNEQSSGFNAISPGYFDTLSVSLLRGRGPERSDERSAEQLVVVNEAFAQKFFDGEDPIGRLLLQGEEPPMRIVGLVSNATYYSLGEEPQTQVYVNLLQRPQSRLQFIVLPQSDQRATVERLVRQKLTQIDPDVAISTTTPLAEVVEQQLARYRTAAVLVGTFALLALVLACIGLYGALSYMVARTTREIGIRLALGARPGQVAARLLRSGVSVVGLATLSGVVAALGLTRYLSHLLFDVHPLDPPSFLLTPIVLLLVSLVASWVPMRRVMATEPTIAIRAD